MCERLALLAIDERKIIRKATARFKIL